MIWLSLCLVGNFQPGALAWKGIGPIFWGFKFWEQIPRMRWFLHEMVIKGEALLWRFGMLHSCGG